VKPPPLGRCLETSIFDVGIRMQTYISHILDLWSESMEDKLYIDYHCMVVIKVIVSFFIDQISYMDAIIGYNVMVEPVYENIQ
jgi:hypothetical protein